MDMDLDFFTIIGLIAAIIGAVILRIEMFYRNACLKIGREIVSEDILAINSTGHQDAITNPKRNKFFTLSCLLILASPFLPIIGGHGANFWNLLVSLGILIFSGLLLSRKLNKEHYLPIIYANLVARAKIFEQQGDTVRAQMAYDVSKLIVDKYSFLQDTTLNAS